MLESTTCVNNKEYYIIDFNNVLTTTMNTQTKTTVNIWVKYSLSHDVINFVYDAQYPEIMKE